MKDDDGRCIWGNRVISQLADELHAADKKVMETGQASFLHEFVTKSTHGNSTLNVCKFVGDLDGQKHVFGISFIIDE